MNEDSVAHRIVANDGSFDTGNIPPGASSQAMTVSADGARYHCSIHPSMIGVVNSTGGTAPPPGAVPPSRSWRRGQAKWRAMVWNAALGSKWPVRS